MCSLQPLKYLQAVVYIFPLRIITSFHVSGCLVDSFDLERVDPLRQMQQVIPTKCLYNIHERMYFVVLQHIVCSAGYEHLNAAIIY